MKREYLIWSLEHSAWWKANWNGYTYHREEAGLYGFEEAVKIVNDANVHRSDVPNEAMIFVGVLEKKLPVRHE